MDQDDGEVGKQGALQGVAKRSLGFYRFVKSLIEHIECVKCPCKKDPNLDLT